MDVPGYEREELIGTGAMAEVWRARSVGEGRIVALKCLFWLRTGLRSRARRGGRGAQGPRPSAHRPGARVGGRRSCVAPAMELAAGGSLADRLASQGRLAPAEVVAMAAPVADALASAHRQGVLHRDVKPANILFTSDGEPLLSDFGVARWAGSPALTGTGHGAVGTAEYLDPAVADGAPADERSDVYALGVVCYEALTGWPPFTGHSPLAVLRAADAGRPVPLADAAAGVPPPLAAVVERAIARRPGERHSTAAELAAALRASLGRPERCLRPTRDFGPRPPRPDGPRRPVVPRFKVAVAAAVLLVSPVLVPTLAGGLSGRAVAAAPRAVRLVQGKAAPTRSCRPPPAGAGVVSGDLAGDGCPSAVLWQGTVAVVPAGPGHAPARYELGAGDRLVLGDCDGRDTPGLYRQASGEVFLFDGWAAPGRDAHSRPAPSGSPGGTARVSAEPGGCDRVVVEPGPEPV